MQKNHANADVDVLIVGAGILGLYQLYRAREDGFSVQVLEAGEGLGGTWFWNRYPGARFDSESYTYAFLFSKELFEEWGWQEHFAAQPETESYLNYASTSSTCAGTSVSVSGSPPRSGMKRPDCGRCGPPMARSPVPGSWWRRWASPRCWCTPGARADGLPGEGHDTGLWPKEPVTFEGKRVAVVGTGASGVQIIPEIVDLVDEGTVYQRTPNWCTPLNNRPVTAGEQASLRACFEQMREILGHLAQRLPAHLVRPEDSSTTPRKSAGRSTRRSGPVPAFPS